MNHQTSSMGYIKIKKTTKYKLAIKAVVNFIF